MPVRVHRFHRSFIIGVIFAWLGPVRGVNAAASADQGPQLEEVVVTAQKRSQNVQDVPGYLTVVSAQQLENQGLTELAEYAKEIPGLTFNSSQAGIGTPVIRGISTGSDASNVVGIYLDDVPMTPSSPFGTFITGFGFDPDVAAIDHIEVLAGPQSTLYGASALGGVIKFATRQPNLQDFEGDVRVGASQIDGGGFGESVRGSANVPIVQDSIGMRVSMFYRLDPGIVDNTYNGLDNVDWTRVYGGSLALRFKLSDTLEDTISGLVQRIYTPSIQEFYVDPNTLKPLNGQITSNAVFMPLARVDTDTVSNSTRWSASVATVTNVLSYSRLGTETVQDFSGLGSICPGFCAPSNYSFRFEGTPVTDRVSDELRLASTPGTFEWLLAGFFTHERDYTNQYNRGYASGQLVPTTDPFYNFFTYRYDATFTERAVFGNLTYHFSKQFEATVGMRYSSYSNPWHSTADGVLAGGSTVEQAYSSGNSANSYLATISYKPTQSATLYARAASGYRPGGSQFVPPPQVASGVNPTFGPDKLWNYEAGVKGEAADRRIVYSADAFHMVWTDLQLGVLQNGIAYTTNVGSAKSDGAEASFTVVPFEGFSAAVNAAYVDARITTDVVSINAVSGEPLPNSPKWSGALVSDYRQRLGSDHFWSAGLTYAYHGSSKSAFTGAAQFAPGVYDLPSYWSLDLRTGLEWSRYTVQFRVQNVTNEYGLLSVANAPELGFPLTGAIITPRTFTLTVSAKF
jgi:iron complex outermembrane recepter protein